MGNKDKHLLWDKTPLPFPMLGFTSDLPVPILDGASGMGIAISPSQFFSALLCSTVSSLRAAVLSGVSVCSSAGSSMGCSGYLLCHGASLPPTLGFPHFLSMGIFCHFFRSVCFPEVPHGWLWAWAMVVVGQLKVAVSGTGQPWLQGQAGDRGFFTVHLWVASFGFSKRAPSKPNVKSFFFSKGGPSFLL